MSKDVNLYDVYYGNLAADPLVAVRRETYDEDVGQASWITLSEAREFFRALELAPGRAALEVACGSGGITCRMARETGATCVGIDINRQGIEASDRTAAEQGLSAAVSFRLVDASSTAPAFPDSPSV
jgi:cyclopropane fatty-acyl-phospholipid synthase-like methyltransferase